MFCHSNTANLKPGTDNQFREPALTPISCERCHGASETHIRRPVRDSIINPVKLSPKLRDSICEQCHLEGEVRILNPGKHWQDFKPGITTESVFGTYVRSADPNQGIKAVSQAEQMALSRCARESGGRLWCGTCHDPHAQAGVNRPVKIREACLSCHASLFDSRQHAPREECASCHMPRISPNNIAHAAITDHLIAIPHSTSTSRAHEIGTVELSAWRPPPDVADRDFGLALFQVGAATKNWVEVSRSYEILSHLPQRDPDVLAALGSILLQQNHADLAVSLYKQALALEPQNARFHYVLGAALAQQSQLSPAVLSLRKSIELDPSAPDAYRKLAQLYQDAGQPAQSKEVIREYLRFMPQNLSFRREQ